MAIKGNPYSDSRTKVRAFGSDKLGKSPGALRPLCQVHLILSGYRFVSLPLGGLGLRSREFALEQGAAARTVDASNHCNSKGPGHRLRHRGTNRDQAYAGTTVLHRSIQGFRRVE